MADEGFIGPGLRSAGRFADKWSGFRGVRGAAKGLWKAAGTGAKRAAIGAGLVGIPAAGYLGYQALFGPDDEERLRDEYYDEMESGRFQGSFNDYLRSRHIPMDREVQGYMRDIGGG